MSMSNLVPLPTFSPVDLVNSGEPNPPLGINGIEGKKKWESSSKQKVSWSDELYMWIRDQLLFNRIAQQTAGLLRGLPPFAHCSNAMQDQVPESRSCCGITFKISSACLKRGFPIPDKQPADDDSEGEQFIVLKSVLTPFSWLPLWVVWGVGLTIFLVSPYRVIGISSPISSNRWEKKLGHSKILLLVGIVLLLLLIGIYYQFSLVFLLTGLLLVAGSSLFLWGVISLSRFVAQRVFLLNFDAPDREEKSRQKKQLIESLKLFDSNLIIVGPPNSGKSALLPPETWRSIDLRQLPRDKRWLDEPEVQKVLQQETLANGLPPGEPEPRHNVAVDHFEYLLGNTPFDEKKLELLEELQNRKIRICVLSSVDFLNRFLPIQSKDHHDHDESDLVEEADLRWARVFHGFSLEYLGYKEAPKALSQLKGFLQTECRLNNHLFEIGQFIKQKDHALNSETLTKRQQLKIVYDVAALAEPWYRSLWATCSKDEKLALFYLAKDRYLYSGNPAINQLIKREIIVLDPSLRIMNESFRRFVLVASENERIEEWEGKGPPSVWRMISRPLGVIFFVIVIFLVGTQEQLRKEAMAIVTLIPAMLPVLIRLFSAMKFGNKPGGVSS